MNLRSTRLANGLTVVTDTMRSVESVSFGAWVETGARHETADINGVSHLLEHMAFKGTTRRSARDIAEEIEAVGGHLNAYTSRENTAFYAKVLKADIGLAVDIIGDILQNSTMADEELDREREVVLQEINQANDTPDDVVFDRLQAIVFPDQPIGRPVLGTAQTVSAMTRPAVLDYMRNNYSAPRMFISAAGNVEHETMVELVEQNFQSLNTEPMTSIEPLRYVGGDFREHRDLEQVQVVLAFPGLAYSDEDYYAASVFSTVFGGGMSSRLFQEIREKRGLSYNVYSFHSSYTDGGMFGVHAGTGEKQVGELIAVVCDEIGHIQAHVDDREIARAATQLKASLLMSLESTSSRCEQRARQFMIFGREITPEEIVAKVDAVDREAVLRAAKRMTSGTLSLATMGRIGQVEDYDKVVSRLS